MTRKLARCNRGRAIHIAMSHRSDDRLDFLDRNSTRSQQLRLFIEKRNHG
jgi:hypothetical protein